MKHLLIGTGIALTVAWFLMDLRGHTEEKDCGCVHAGNDVVRFNPVQYNPSAYGAKYEGLMMNQGGSQCRWTPNAMGGGI